MQLALPVLYVQLALFSIRILEVTANASAAIGVTTGYAILFTVKAAGAVAEGGVNPVQMVRSTDDQ